MAVVSSSDFVVEIQQMVRAKHSKNHPIIGMIEEGKLSTAKHSKASSASSICFSPSRSRSQLPRC